LWNYRTTELNNKGCVSISLGITGLYFSTQFTWRLQETFPVKWSALGEAVKCAFHLSV